MNLLTLLDELMLQGSKHSPNKNPTIEVTECLSVSDCCSESGYPRKRYESSLQ